MRVKLVVICIVMIIVNITGFSRQAPASVVEKVKSNDELLARYIEQLNADTERHRSYIESYYNKLYNSVLIAAGLIGAVMTYGGHKYFSYHFEKYKKNLKRKFDEHFIEHYKVKFDEYNEETQRRFVELAIAKVEMDEMISAFNGDVNSNRALLDSINDKYLDLSFKVGDNFIINKSLTRLEYMNTGGSLVNYVKEQTVRCISRENPVKSIPQFLSVDSPGEVISVHVFPPDRQFAKIPINPQKQLIQLKFNDFNINSEAQTTKINWQVKDGFKGNKENFVINQFNECHEEIFELVTLNERQCKNIDCIIVDTSGVETSEIVQYTTNVSVEGIKSIHKITLPQSPTPCRYKITWEFES